MKHLKPGYLRISMESRLVGMHACMNVWRHAEKKKSKWINPTKLSIVLLLQLLLVLVLVCLRHRNHGSTSTCKGHKRKGIRATLWQCWHRNGKLKDVQFTLHTSFLHFSKGTCATRSLDKNGPSRQSCFNWGGVGLCETTCLFICYETFFWQIQCHVHDWIYDRKMIQVQTLFMYGAYYIHLAAGYLNRWNDPGSARTLRPRPFPYSQFGQTGRTPKSSFHGRYITHPVETRGEK